jgi:hypothetical protein
MNADRWSVLHMIPSEDEEKLRCGVCRS